MQVVSNDKATAAQLKDMKIHKLHVKIDSAREMYQSAIGAHPDQSMHAPFMSAIILNGICSSSRRASGHSSIDLAISRQSLARTWFDTNKLLRW